MNKEEMIKKMRRDIESIQTIIDFSKIVGDKVMTEKMEKDMMPLKEILKAVEEDDLSLMKKILNSKEIANKSKEGRSGPVEAPSSKEQLFGLITNEMRELYKIKNKAYGDSFGESFKEHGMTMPCIRLDDKLNRLKQLVKGIEPNDESIEDTLIDLANYSVMTLIELRRNK